MFYLALNQARDLGLAAVNSEAEKEIYGFSVNVVQKYSLHPALACF